ncbi:MAG: hydantoinase [endosymbiont of Galathealinum brachiosum]|uniref:Hydantoinase n=1 Tax=endosymbiont of Galathealinum brachiosum TaxID=2200906 RepID=A0A370DDJ6_9GAMM|nr:MAG: hydantoinase [endosymbiont of Galathealinum brachiosum]
MLTHWLGVDTGGTFTDFVYFDGKSIQIHKVLSTPDAPERAILKGIDELGISLDGLHLIHGSTVATNAVLEGKGVKTVYITNTGFADVLTIGRQARRELYNLMPEPSLPLIPADCCIEVNTRLSAKGELLKDLNQSDIDCLIKTIEKITPASVAINLLFSFVDNIQEQKIKKQLTDSLESIFVCCSSDVLPEYKEYERGMATVLNAYVGPLMQGYLYRLLRGLEKKPGKYDVRPCLSVLQSSGGTIQAAQAGKYAVNLLLSGPAGGLKGALYVAGLSGESKLMSFDMGGTSTDVALIDERIKLSSEGYIGQYPVAVPMVDMHTIGAGGGSIAYVDAGGLLNVGPESAGASPGPACYDQGGILPTVTDANLVLGRLQAEGFLGKGMQLNVAAAREALGKIAVPLGLSVEESAQGIIEIANEHMVRALRTISVQRGFDPQEFALTCFGGAGGLHVCALADALKMQRAIVPIHGGVLSALGMLVAVPGRDLSHSCIQKLLSSDRKNIESLFVELETRGIDELQDEITVEPRIQRSADLRYQGQSFTLNLPWSDELNQLEQSFHELHKNTYGHDLEIDVELVNLRVSIKGDETVFKLPELSENKKIATVQKIDCYGFEEEINVYQREELAKGQKIKGPALILETVSTTLIDAGWSCLVDDWGNLLLYKN